MGIAHLMSFVAKIPNAVKQYELHDQTVIFDGKSLIPFLYYKYELDYIHGGEYQKYSDSISSFMLSFKKCGITPIVVIDGGYVKKCIKLKISNAGGGTLLKRVNSINTHGQQHHKDTVIPLLIVEVLHSVLDDLDIPLLITDYSADDQVTVQANHHKCPVISNNSEFYILDASCGFILLNSINTTAKTGEMSDGVEYNFLECNMYHIDAFVKFFPGLDKYTLPILGTLMTEIYFKHKTFKKFFAELSEYAGGELFLEEERHKIMANLLCWLQHTNVNIAMAAITSYLKKTRRENVIYEIKSLMDLYQCSVNNNIDFKSDSDLNGMITTPCEEKLPTNFIQKYRTDFSRFFIHVICKHRVFLAPQIEDLKADSSHKCSSYVRQILYGILLRHDANGTVCRNKKCNDGIEEWDREGKVMKNTKVQPIYSVKGIGQLPTVNDVHSFDKENCITIIAKVLGICSEFLVDLPDAWQLYIASINYWLRHSIDKSQSLISAVTLNLIYFGLIKAKKNPFPDPEVCPKKTSKSLSCMCSKITCIGANVNNDDRKNAEKVLQKYYTSPSPKLDPNLPPPKLPSLLKFNHDFSQLKSCLLHIIYLNRLLNNHLINPNPENCFSGVMLFNLVNDIPSTVDSENFFRPILGKQLYSLFSHLKSKICENVN